MSCFLCLAGPFSHFESISLLSSFQPARSPNLPGLVQPSSGETRGAPWRRRNSSACDRNERRICCGAGSPDSGVLGGRREGCAFGWLELREVVDGVPRVGDQPLDGDRRMVGIQAILDVVKFMRSWHRESHTAVPHSSHRLNFRVTILAARSFLRVKSRRDPPPRGRGPCAFWCSPTWQGRGKGSRGNGKL